MYLIHKNKIDKGKTPAKNSHQYYSVGKKASSFLNWPLTDICNIRLFYIFNLSQITFGITQIKGLWEPTGWPSLGPGPALVLQWTLPWPYNTPNMAWSGVWTVYSFLWKLLLENIDDAIKKKFNNYRSNFFVYLHL